MLRFAFIFLRKKKIRVRFYLNKKEFDRNNEKTITVSRLVKNLISSILNNNERPVSKRRSNFLCIKYVYYYYFLIFSFTF